MSKSTKSTLSNSTNRIEFFKNPIKYVSSCLKIKSNEYAIYVLIIFTISSIFLVFTSHVNIDENFYTYCAKLVMEGFIPYVDFFFTQSPVLLYVYGVPLQIFGNNLLNSRLITFTFLFITAILIIKIGKNVNYEWAGICAVLAMAPSWWILYNLIIIKTYTLTLFFIVLALFIYSKDMKSGWKYILSILFMGLAGGVRLNIAALPIFLSCWIAVKEWNKDSKLDLLKNLMKYLLISAFVLILIYGPIFLLDLFENHSLNKSIYNLIGVHSNRNLTMNMSLGLSENIGFIFDAILTYSVISFLLIFLPIYFYITLVRKKDLKSVFKNYEMIFLIFFTQLIVIGFYMMLSTLFAEYIISILPLTLLIVFIGLIKLFRFNRFHHPNVKIFQKKYESLIFVAIVCILPLTQLAQINLYVVPRMGQPLTERFLYNDLRQYQDVSNIIHLASPPWGYIMTYDSALTNQAERNLLPGYEMSYFSYHHWFEPFGLLWPVCVYYHVINGQMVYNQLKSNLTTMAVFTLGQAFFTFLNEKLDNPLFYGNNITEVLNSDYNLIVIYPGFGQVNDILFIFQRKNLNSWINLPGIPFDPFNF
ncbi:MAG: ArnT family glycosyltransferase [Candidatus Helarchaeota archaeon]